MTTDAAPNRSNRQPVRADGQRRVVTSLSVFPDRLAEWKQQAHAEGVSLSHWISLRLDAEQTRQAG